MNEIMQKQIIAIGGGVLLPDTGNFKLETYIVEVSGKARPRILFVPTASGDDTGSIARFYESYARFGAELSVLPFFRRTPQDVRDLVLSHDVVHVGGGNTRSMLAVWRDWGMDAALAEAYERGIILCGSSAGSICWFAEGVTDSIAGDLTRLDCLAFLPGSNCPHYDGERDRRPAFQKMVAERVVSDGLACDDGVGLHYIDGKLHEIPSARPAARAYRVCKNGASVHEEALAVRQL
jgi:peptidase E